MSRRKRAVLISILALLATVPWFFRSPGIGFLGLPPWALYSLVATVLYAIIIAFLIGRFWSDMAGDD